MKFTEEQFNRLVEIQEDQYQIDLFSAPRDDYSSIGDTVTDTDNDLQFFIYQYDLGNEAVALMNPLTREWAHDQFVEKGKRYVWRLKKDNDMVISKTSDNWYLDKFPTLNKGFTETEIKKSPFKPEWFDKEEVD